LVVRVKMKDRWGGGEGAGADCICRFFGASHGKGLQQPRGWGFFRFRTSACR
jgi:hypothetical protein